jgi:hypothetical protein
MSYLADDSGVATSKPLEHLRIHEHARQRSTRRTSYQQRLRLRRQRVHRDARSQARPVSRSSTSTTTSSRSPSSCQCSRTCSSTRTAGVGARRRRSLASSGSSRVQRAFENWRASSCSRRASFVQLRSAAASANRRVHARTPCSTSGPEYPAAEHRAHVAELPTHVLYDSLCQINRFAAANSGHRNDIHDQRSDFRTLTVSTLGAFTATGAQVRRLRFTPVSGERRSIVLHNKLHDDRASTCRSRTPATARRSSNGCRTIQLYRGCDRLASRRASRHVRQRRKLRRAPSTTCRAITTSGRARLHGLEGSDPSSHESLGDCRRDRHLDRTPRAQ